MTSGKNKRLRTVHEHGIIVDPETGEARSAIFQRDAIEDSLRGGRRTRRVSMTFAMVDQMSVADLELSHLEHRVVSMLLSVADPADAGRSSITVTRIALLLEIAQPNVSRVLRDLRLRRVVFKEGPALWRVTPWYAWVGNWKDWDKTAREFPEPEWKRS